MGAIKLLWRRLICFPIKGYQYFLSPLMPSCCRYYPSCSEYAQNAIEYHGVLKGLWWALKRILRCHPWARGGYDPIHPNNETL